MLGVTACASPVPTPTDSGSPEPSNNSRPPEPSDTPDGSENTGGKALVAYFSRTGNTEAIADMIAENTGADLFKVETVTPYPENYEECTAVAQQEQNSGARPELSTHVEDMSQYDIIYIGYPIWWGKMPMAMFTFLEEYDFSGKTILPFCTHGGSGLGSSADDIMTLCPDAQVLEGLAVSGSSAGSSQSSVENWLAGLELAD